MSLPEMASTRRLPTPGQEKMLSMTIAPPSIWPRLIPRTVMVGRRAFFRACLRTTYRRVRPFETAKAMYGCPITSSMPVRTIRKVRARAWADRATAGSTRYFVSPYPATGNSFRFTAKKRIRRRASQNPGIDTPMSVTILRM